MARRCAGQKPRLTQSQWCRQQTSLRAARPRAVRRSSLARRFARLFVRRPARHLVLTAAVDHGPARGAALEVRRVRLLGAAARESAAAPARCGHAGLHSCFDCTLRMRLRLDFLLDAALLQHATALQPIPRARQQLHQARIQSICTSLSNGAAKFVCERRIIVQRHMAPRLLHQLRGVHDVFSKRLEHRVRAVGYVPTRLQKYPCRVRCSVQKLRVPDQRCMTVSLVSRTMCRAQMPKVAGAPCLLHCSALALQQRTRDSPALQRVNSAGEQRDMLAASLDDEGGVSGHCGSRVCAEHMTLMQPHVQHHEVVLAQCARGQSGATVEFSSAQHVSFTRQLVRFRDERVYAREDVRRHRESCERAANTSGGRKKRERTHRVEQTTTAWHVRCR